MKLLIIPLMILSFLFGSSQGQSELCESVGDVIFLVDQSTSTVNKLTEIKNFLITIINNLDIDVPNKIKIRIGLITFASNVIVRIPLGGYNSKQDILDAISNINNPGGNSALGDGISSSWTQLRNGLSNGSIGTQRNTMIRPDSSIPRVIFIFTDGIPIGGTLSSNKASHLLLGNKIKTGTYGGDILDINNNGNQLPYPVQIFVVAVSQIMEDVEFLSQLSSGSPENFRQIDDFDDLPNVQTEISTQLCNSIPTASPTSEPNIGGSGLGDVHWITQDGVVYTFNAAGDYIYLRNEEFIEIHVRTAMVGYASSIAALAIQDKHTSTTLELWWIGKSQDDLRMNFRNSNGNNQHFYKEKQNNDALPFYVKNFNPEKREIVIGHAKYKKFELLARYGGRASFIVELPKNWKTEGLAGNNNGYWKDDLCDRRGKCLSLNSTSLEIHDIALDWKANPTELLFQQWMPVKDWELKYHQFTPSKIQLKHAYQLCGQVQPCIFDYISTGSEEYALHTKFDFESITNDNEHYILVGDHY